MSSVPRKPVRVIVLPSAVARRRAEREARAIAEAIASALRDFSAGHFTAAYELHQLGGRLAIAIMAGRLDAEPFGPAPEGERVAS